MTQDDYQPRWEKSSFDCPECGAIVWLNQDKDVAKCDECGRRREIEEFWPGAVKQRIAEEMHE